MENASVSAVPSSKRKLGIKNDVKRALLKSLLGRFQTTRRLSMLMNQRVRFRCPRAFDHTADVCRFPDGGAIGRDVLEFELCPFSLDDKTVLYIYECVSCTGCGCPTFTKARDIPEDIVEHLERHVLMHALRVNPS